MRTAVIRINIDPEGTLSDLELHEGLTVLTEKSAAMGIGIVDPRVEVLPPTRRELEFLMTGVDTAAMQSTVTKLCADALATTPTPGPVTFVSRGTDEDVHGILAGFGIVGSSNRVEGADGFDIITVTLTEADLARVPESRIHTALEASTNCEIIIITS